MTYIFESGLAHHIEGLIQQKRADGYHHIRCGHTCPSSELHRGSGADRRLASTFLQVPSVGYKIGSAMTCRCPAVSR